MCPSRAACSNAPVTGSSPDRPGPVRRRAPIRPRTIVLDRVVKGSRSSNLSCRCTPPGLTHQDGRCPARSCPACGVKFSHTMPRPVAHTAPSPRLFANGRAELNRSVLIFRCDPLQQLVQLMKFLAEPVHHDPSRLFAHVHDFIQIKAAWPASRKPESAPPRCCPIFSPSPS